MKKRSHQFSVLLLTAWLASPHAQAALIRFIWDGAAGDGESFVDAGNWGGEASDGTNIPGDVVDAGAADASNVILQSAGVTTTVTAPFTPVNPFDVLIVRSGHRFDLSADMDLGLTPTLVGQTGTGSAFNHTAGAFTTGNLNIGDALQPGSGSYNLSGAGSVTAAGVNVRINSSLRLTGDTTSFTAANLSIDDTSALDFIFGPTGVNPIGLSAGFNVTSGASLNLNGAAYTGGAGTVDLVTFGSNTGTFADPADITINGFSGFNAAVGYDASRMFVTLTAIPEPSSRTLLLVGGLAVCTALRRR